MFSVLLRHGSIARGRWQGYNLPMLLARIGYALLTLPDRIGRGLDIHRFRIATACDDSVFVGPTAKIRNDFEVDAVDIGAGSMFHGEIVMNSPSSSLKIGEYSFVGPGAVLWANESITVGRGAQISHGVQIVAHRPIVIEDHAWIGFNAMIASGVRIGEGAIIAACSIVTEDVPPFTTVGGVPIRKIGESRP